MPHPRKRLRILVAMAYWMEPLYAGIARKAVAHDWVLDDALRWQHELPDTALTWDGAIVFAWKNETLVHRLREARIPLVDLEDYVDHFGASKVLGDDVAVGRVAADHLIRAGCRSLVFVAANLAFPVSVRRAEGFSAVARAAGIPVTIVADATAARDAVKAGVSPAGVFGNGDKIALETERALLDSGFRIPEDAAVLGANDTQHLCELAPVALSSVNMDFEGKGEAAADLMHALLTGNVATHLRVIVPPRGVTARASTRRVADSAGDAFARLVATLERRCGETEGVGAMCRAAGLSLPEARRLVRDRLGRTLVEELSRLRVERAKALLSSGTMNMQGVAAACGFGTRQSLYLAFRKFEKRTPEEFRKSAPPG